MLVRITTALLPAALAVALGGLALPEPALAATGPALAVDATAGRHPISPYVYGMNFADAALARDIRLPVNRYGGNATTRYNFRADTTNRAADWYFENIPNDNADPESLPEGLRVRPVHRSGTRRTGAEHRADPADARLDREGTGQGVRRSASPSTARRSPPTRGPRTAATARSPTARTSPATTRGTPASPSAPSTSPTGSPTSRRSSVPPATAGSGSTTWTTSPTCGTAPTATSARPGSATTSYATGPTSTPPR